MNTFNKYFLSFCLVLFVLPFAAKAQVELKDRFYDTAQVYIVKLVDGSEFVGKIIEKDKEKFVFSTAAIPRMEILFSNVKSIEMVSPGSMKTGVYWFPNPRPTNYFFWPSAINLKKGEGYFQNNMLFLNSVHYGITDNFSIGGGLEFISTFSGEPFVFFTPKFSFPVAEKFHLGGGVLLMSLLDEGSAGMLFGSGTYGTQEHNLSASLGFGFAGGEFASTPMVVVGGMTRVAKRLMLVSENWIFPIGDGESFSLFSFGVRILGDKIAADVGLVMQPDIGVPFPIAGFSVKF